MTTDEQPTIEELRREVAYAQAEALFFHRWIEQQYGKAVRIAAALAWDRGQHSLKPRGE